MRNFSSLVKEAILQAEALGHRVDERANGPLVCLECREYGRVSPEPLISPGEVVGKYNHGPIFQGKCTVDLNE